MSNRNGKLIWIYFIIFYYSSFDSNPRIIKLGHFKIDLILVSANGRKFKIQVLPQSAFDLRTYPQFRSLKNFFFLQNIEFRLNFEKLGTPLRHDSFIVFKRKKYFKLT